VAGGAIVLAPGAALASGEWPQFQSNAAHTGFVADGVQAPFEETWHLDVPTGGPDHQFGLSAPVLSEDTIVVVGSTEVIGMDLGSGEQRWSVSRDYGPSVAPAVATVGGKDVLVFTEGFGSNPPRTSASASATNAATGSSGPSASVTSSPASKAGAFDSHVAAIDLATQRPLWDPVPLERVSRTGVTVDGETAFVGDNAGNIKAIDIGTGQVDWTRNVGGYVDTALAVSGGNVYAAVQGNVDTTAAIVALNEDDGSQVWRYEAGRRELVTAPSVAGDAVLAGFAGSSTSIRAIDAGTGAERWKSPVNTVPAPFGAPAVTGRSVVGIDLDGQTYLFDLVSGERTWDFALNDPTARSTPVVSGQQVLVTTNSGRVAALDARTGELVWQNAPTFDLLRDPLVTTNLLVVVRGGAHPGLVAFAHDPSGSLVRVASPTTTDPARLFGMFVIAAVPLGTLLVFAGRWLTARAGPGFTSEPTEVVDEWENDDDRAGSDEDDEDGDEA
jgi:outer membrane protein assembly factor BamB